MVIDNSGSLHIAIDPELKRKGLLYKVNFSEAIRLGLKILLRKEDGVESLMQRGKEIIEQIDLLKKELVIIKEEIVKLKAEENKKEDLKKKEEKDKSLNTKKKMMKAIRMNNPVRYT